MEDTIKAETEPDNEQNKSSDDISLKIFLNPLILKNISRHLETEDLIRLRLVSRLWKIILTTEMNLQQRIIKCKTFYTNEEVTKFLHLKDLEWGTISKRSFSFVFDLDNINLENLESFFHQNEDFVIKELTFLKSNISSLNFILCKNPDRFNNLNSLTINFDKDFSNGIENNAVNNGHAFKTSKNWILPNLQHLTLGLSKTPMSPNKYKKILKSASNIQFLKIISPESYESNNLEIFLRILMLPKYTPKYVKKFNLTTNHGINDALIEKLTQIFGQNTEIEQVYLNGFINTFNTNVYSGFSTVLRPSLSYLFLYSSENIEHLTHLEKLKSLEINKIERVSNIKPITDGKNFPNLESLTIGQFDLWSSFDLKSESIEGQRLESLKTLKVKEFGQFIPEILFYSLFQNITSIEVPTNNREFKVIIQNCQKLEIIKILSEKFNSNKRILTDSGIVGINFNNIKKKRFADALNLSCKELEKVLPSLICDKNYSGISTLKNLKVFDAGKKSLNFKAPFSKFTDFAVIFGLRFCKNLSTLNLECSKVSNLSMDLLANELNLKSLNIKSCRNISTECIKKLKDKNFALYFSSGFM